MPNPPVASRYKEIEINTATPTELIVMLYEAALAHLAQAEAHMNTRDISLRSRSVNKFLAIMTELQASLNFEAGGEIAVALENLYNYMKQRVFQANLHQDPEPLREVKKLMAGLRGAWVQVAREESRRPFRDSVPGDRPDRTGVANLGICTPAPADSLSIRA